MPGAPIGRDRGIQTPWLRGQGQCINHLHLVDIENSALASGTTETRVVIFTGTGKHFSSGADLDGGGPAADSPLERRGLARIGEHATLAIYHMEESPSRRGTVGLRLAARYHRAHVG